MLRSAAHIMKKEANLTQRMMKGKLIRRPKTMLSMEKKLPPLPVPPLQQTMQKYLTMLEPLLFDSEYENTKQIVTDFQKPGGVGEKLQKKLEEKAETSENWLSEWWDNCAYFDYRAPVVINSSPGIQFPKQNFETDTDQYRYTAKLIREVVRFKEVIDNELLPVDYAGKDPLTMKQYKKLLSVCRIPHARRDGDITTPPDESQHVVVAHNNHFFKLDVYDRATGEILDEGALVRQLSSIVDNSQHVDEYPVGVLTSQDRNTWANAWKRLTRDSQNKANVDAIIKSICLICLDQPYLAQPTQYKFEAESGLGQMIHGGGTHENSMNRWFDKICQFVINRNGTCGMCYEHSGAEGPPVMTLGNKIMGINMNETVPDKPTYKQIEAPEKMIWNLNYDMIDRIELAKDHIDQISSDLEIRIFDFNKFGKSVPKRFKMSPDAFFQVSLQLAYYRLHGHHPPTYESGSIRKFARGRTETIRSATPAAARFAREMDRNNCSNAEKKDLFMNAIKAHVQYTKDAINFQAVDRHMLGLKLTALSSGMSIPEIFRDKAYGYAMHIRLSTSQVPSKYEALLGFGPVVPDGYGCCYNPMEQRIIYAVSACNSHPKTRAGEFGEAIAKSLEDNHVLLATQAKL